MKSISTFELIIMALVSIATISVIKYFGYQGQTWQKVDIQLTSDYKNNNQLTVPFWLIDSIKVGDIEKSANGKISAEVLSIEAYEQDEDNVAVFMTVSLRTLLNKRTGQILYNNQPISIDSMINLNINNHSLSGVVTGINLITDNSKINVSVDAILRFRFLEPWQIELVANQIPIVIKEIKSQQPILTINSITSQSPITTSLLEYNSLSNTRPIITNQTTLKDVVVNAVLTMDYRNNKWYFSHNQLLKIGSVFTISSPEIGTLNAEVQRINFPKSE